MGFIELSGLPPVDEIVEAWVNVMWVSVYWDGEVWRYWRTHLPVEAHITHWAPLAGLKVQR